MEPTSVTASVENVQIQDPRGYFPEHQKLVLKIYPIEQRVLVTSEIILRVSERNVSFINLNARHNDIKRIKLNDIACSFDYSNMSVEKFVAEKVLADEPIQYPNKVRQALLSSRSRDELKIMVPSSLALIAGSCLSLYIEYELNANDVGIDFLVSKKGEDAVSYLQVCAFAVAGMGRVWMPCFEQDSISWDLEYHIYVNQLSILQIAHLNMASSGALCQQFLNAEQGFKLFHFKLDIPTISSQIAFACGLFDMVKVPAAPFAMAFCPVGMGSKLSLVMEFLSRSFGFINWYLTSSFPYPSYYVIYIRDILGVEDRESAANMSFFSTLALFDPMIIDQNLVTRLLLCESLAQQYFGIRLRGARWLTEGVGGYLARLMLRVFHGNNDFCYNTKRDIERVVEMEQDRPSLAEIPEIFSNPTDEEWLRLKSYLTILILEHRLEKGVLHKILSNIWSEFTDDRMEEGLTNGNFLKICKRVSGKDMRSFADQWILTAGCPVFTCSFTFNRKKSTIDVDFKQSTPGNAQKKVIGSLLIRVHEVDGVFDHSVHIDDFSHHFELPVHAKAKKIKKRKKLLDTNTVSSIGGALAPQQPQQPLQMEDETEAEVKEEDEFVSPLSWIRLDPEMEWIATLELHQPEYMLIEQLQNDKDAVAQSEAIHFLKRAPSDAVVEALEKILNDAKCFYKVRIDAALGLAVCAPTVETHLGGLKLISFYNKGFALQSSETVVVPVPRTNNFEALQPYFILTSIPIALATVRTKNATLMELIGQILLNMLRFNDNAGNNYSDNYHVARIIKAMIVHIRGRKEFALPTERLSKEFVKELDRYAIVERIQPYYHNTVMVAIIEAWRDLWQMDIPHSVAISSPEMLIKEGNFIYVRLATMDYLLQTLNEITSTMMEGLEMLRSPKKMVRNVYIKALAQLSSKKVKCGSRFGDQEIKARLWEFFVFNYRDPKLAAYYLTFIGKVIDVASADLAEIQGERLSLKIVIPAKVGAEEEISGKAKNTMDEDEPDWFYEVSGEQGIKPRGPTPKLKLSVAPLSTSLAARLQQVLKSIWDHYDSFPFRAPVDPSVVGYYDVIKNPMDLGTIQNRLRAGINANLQQFCADLRLIFEDCFYFNQPDSMISEQAKRLRAHAIKELKKVFPEHAKDIRALLMTSTIVTLPDKSRETSTKPPKRPRVPSVMNASLSERMALVLQKTTEHPYAFWFLSPVDPVTLNIPTYFDIIKEPMDLGTLGQKLANRNIENNPGEFLRLLDLIFTNCIKFNTPNTVVHQNALEIRKATQKLTKKYLPEVEVPSPITSTSRNKSIIKLNLSKAVAVNVHSPSPTKKVTLKFSIPTTQPPATITTTSADHLWRPDALNIIEKVSQHEYAEPFVRPVDPIALGIPSYLKIIKEPMDLSTIHTKLKEGKYKRPAEMNRDFKLVFSNCYKFNGKTAPISEAAKVLERFYDSLYSSVLCGLRAEQ